MKRYDDLARQALRAGNEASAVEAKYAQMSSDASVEDELASLKEDVGL